MPRTRSSLAAAAISLVLAGTGTALLAQRTGPYGPGWGEPRWGADRDVERSLRRASAAREGKVDVAQFRAEGDAALALGRGAIAIKSVSHFFVLGAIAQSILSRIFFFLFLHTLAVLVFAQVAPSI